MEGGDFKKILDGSLARRRPGTEKGGRGPAGIPLIVLQASRLHKFRFVCNSGVPRQHDSVMK
jgi:hypothetical protein